MVMLWYSDTRVIVRVVPRITAQIVRNLLFSFLFGGRNLGRNEIGILNLVEVTGEKCAD
jgi:hypothetical protein